MIGGLNGSSERSERLRGCTILVIDDDADALLLLQIMLRNQGASVMPASSGLEAMSFIKSGQIDLILSDIGMPEMDGYELLTRIRAFETESGTYDGNIVHIPAIAVSAFSRPEDRVRSLEVGYAAHVSKPVNPAALLAAIFAVAGSSSYELFTHTRW